MGINSVYVNPNAVFTIEWCPNIGDKTERVTILVEIEGTISRGTQQPVQNLLVSVRGTRIKTTVANEYTVGQFVRFLNRWWTIDDVTIDLTSCAPQAAAFTGTFTNAVYLLSIVGCEVRAQ